jgi:hypothetical protein
MRLVVVCAAGAAALGLLAMGGCKASNKGARPNVHAERTDVVRIFTPDWYDETPRGDDKSIYKTAQSVGASPVMAENLSINQARQEMALSIDARVDALQRNFQEQLEAMDELDLLQRFQDANTIVASKSLRGSHVVRKETYVEDNGTYRCFVLMQMDGREIDAAMLDAARQIEALETRLRSSEAWQEMERRAKELRMEKGGGIPPITDKELMGTSQPK